MDAFGPNHYVPVLFTKAGERDALKVIDDSAKKRFTPLLVVHPIAWDFESDQPEKTIDAHLSKLPAELVKSWGKRDAFIDVRHVDGELLADGQHPIRWLVTQGRLEGLPLVPVVTPSYSTEYIDGVRSSCRDRLMKSAYGLMPANGLSPHRMKSLTPLSQISGCRKRTCTWS